MNRLMRALKQMVSLRSPRVVPVVPQEVPYEDMLILQGEGTLPGIPNEKLLEHYANTRVSKVFVTEDDLDNSGQVEKKVAYFMNAYGMQANKVKVVVAIARNPTCNWGRGFPFKMRISIFPRYGYELLENEN